MVYGVIIWRHWRFGLLIFTSSYEGSLPCSHTDWTFPHLNHAERRGLNHEVAEAEITTTMFQMGLKKAVGPNGFLPRFFQWFWGIVGPSVCGYVQLIFRSGVI